jgi:Mn2+/Fe2+ NRAMP family transporter
MSKQDQQTGVSAPPIPRSFLQYLKGFGPGLVVVLTWLGAGDLVDSATAGSNYGYALMWGLALSLLLRFFIVNVIARYQLCNQYGETVMSAFKRIHKAVPIMLGIVAILFGHIYSSYVIKGLGESFHYLVFGFGPAWLWSIIWVTVIGFIAFSGKFNRIIKVFYFSLALLSISLIGIAISCKPDIGEIVRGTLMFEIPADKGGFSALLIVVSLIGAVVGSIANLLYPYFIQQKGWVGPQYRRVQLYDLLFGILVIIVLDLAVWIVGAELLHPKGLTISSIDDLANLLTMTLGKYGAPIFYLGVFAALFNSQSGSTVGYGYMICDIVHKVKTNEKQPLDRDKVGTMLTYKLVALWCLVSPLIWLLPGMPDFVTLTILGNAASAVMFPVVALPLWYITAHPKFIGPDYKNKIWENILIGLLFCAGIWMSYHSILQIVSKVSQMF